MQELNTKMQNFNYGSTKVSKKPPKISMNRLLKGKDLKLFASEPCSIFSLIVGDLVPKNNYVTFINVYVNLLIFYSDHGLLEQIQKHLLI